MAVRRKTSRTKTRRGRKGTTAEAMVAAADAHDVPLWVLVGVKLLETGSDTGTGAVSSAGAQGPFQFMPSTAASLGVKDPNNFAEAADGAAKLLAENHKKYGSWNAALEAYNGGGGAVGKGYAYTEADAKAKLREFGLGSLARGGSRNVSWSPLDLSPLWRLFHGEAPIPKYPGQDQLPLDGGSGGDLGDVPKDVLGIPGEISQAAAATTTLISMLTDIHFWIRVGEALAAFILIYMGLHSLTGVGPTPSNVVGAAAATKGL